MHYEVVLYGFLYDFLEKYVVSVYYFNFVVASGTAKLDLFCTFRYQAENVPRTFKNNRKKKL